MISEEQVARVALLSRLMLTKEETVALAQQLSSVLKHFEQVSTVNTEGVEPLITATDMVNDWRNDKVEPWGSVELAMENAPEAVGNLFRVPPVVG